MIAALNAQRGKSSAGGTMKQKTSGSYGPKHELKRKHNVRNPSGKKYPKGLGFYTKRSGSNWMPK